MSEDVTERIENAVAVLQKHGLVITGFMCTPETLATIENSALSVAMVDFQVIHQGRPIEDYPDEPPEGIGRGVGSAAAFR